MENETEEEELIAQDGIYEELLPYTVLPAKSARSGASSKSNKKPSSKIITSRVCSGSRDPDVLKEQLLIALFDDFWPEVTDIISPLLQKYAKHIIEQSAQLSSLSRESSTKGSRATSQLNKKSISREYNLPPTPSPIKRMSSATVEGYYERMYESQSNHRMTLNSKTKNDYQVNRRLSRPTSAINRLPPTDNQHQQNIAVQQLHDLLLITSKPLQHSESKSRVNISSALKNKRYSIPGSAVTSSIVSLPAVNTQGGSGSLINTPRVQSSGFNSGNSRVNTQLANKSEQRPASSSSSFSRRR